MTRCFPMTFCLSSLLFMRTMDRFAEVSDANRTYPFPVMPNETMRACQTLSDGTVRRKD